MPDENQAIVDETILDEAKRLTRGERQDSYDTPTASFTAIGNLWGSLLATPKWKQGEPVPPELVADLMILMKVSRNQHRRKRDNYVDIAGYSDCGWRALNKEC